MRSHLVYQTLNILFSVLNNAHRFFSEKEMYTLREMGIYQQTFEPFCIWNSIGSNFGATLEHPVNC